MNKNTNRRIDELLQQWADTKAPSAEDLERLRDELAGQLEVSEPSLSRESPIPSRSHQWRQLVASVAAVVALLLIAVAIQKMFSSRQGHPVPRGTSPSQFVQMSRDDIASKTLLLSEMQQLFDKRLAWVVELDDKVQLDIVENGDTVAAPFLAFRVALVSRNAAEEEWKLSWTMDVLSRDQDVMQIKQPENAADAITIWAYRLPDGNVAVDVDAKVRSVGRLQSHGSVVLEPGVPGTVLTGHHDGTEYRIYQNVAVVHDMI